MDNSETKIPADINNKKIDILVVEDDAIANRVLSLQLNTICQCNIQNTFDVKSTMTHLDTIYDIIFTDFQLCDGPILPFVKHYHQQHPSVPIIAITAYITEQDHQQLLHYGAKDVLIKPVCLDILKELLNRY